MHLYLFHLSQLNSTSTQFGSDIVIGWTTHPLSSPTYRQPRKLIFPCNLILTWLEEEKGAMCQPGQPHINHITATCYPYDSHKSDNPHTCYICHPHFIQMHVTSQPHVSNMSVICHQHVSHTYDMIEIFKILENSYISIIIASQERNFVLVSNGVMELWSIKTRSSCSPNLT